MCGGDYYHHRRASDVIIIILRGRITFLILHISLNVQQQVSAGFKNNFLISREKGIFVQKEKF